MLRFLRHDWRPCPSTLLPTTFVGLLLVSAGVGLAGHKHGGSGALLAGAISKGVENASYGDVGGEDAQDHDG
jgi:hypothetical protein